MAKQYGNSYSSIQNPDVFLNTRSPVAIAGLAFIKTRTKFES